MRQVGAVLARGQFVPVRFGHLAAALTVAWAMLAGGPAGARETEMAPHRALYDLSLAASRQGSGIVAVEGGMAVDWAEACEGWTMTQQFVLRVGGEGGDAEISSHATSWETRDGRQYRFSVRNMANGAETERISGQAQMPAGGGPGEAVFEQPKPRRLVLPPGTLFPTQHAYVVLGEVDKAPTIIGRHVFDGMTEEGLVEINAAIGRAIAPGSPIPELAGRASWPLDMAFFANRDDSTPEHEIAMRVFDNGVVDDLRLDFGEFAVLAKLKRLELRPHPHCD